MVTALDPILQLIKVVLLVLLVAQCIGLGEQLKALRDKVTKTPK